LPTKYRSGGLRQYIPKKEQRRSGCDDSGCVVGKQEVIGIWDVHQIHVDPRSLYSR